MPTPIKAVRSGKPAATTEPSVMNSTTAATTIPIASVEPIAGLLIRESLGNAVIPVFSTAVTASMTEAGTDSGSDIC
ncbi:hypothetical protein D3C78_1767870 [compost metagenome]